MFDMSKNIINERVSDVLFHFTTLDNMVYIAKDNSLLATPTGANASDFKLGIKTMKGDNKLKYPYYFCFSRTPSSAIGYPAMRRNTLLDSKNGWDRMVRIKVDGDYINSNFRGNPVNYFDPTYNGLNKATSFGWSKVNQNPIQHKLTADNDNFVSKPYSDAGISFGYFTIYHRKGKKIDLESPVMDNDGRPLKVKSENEFQEWLRNNNLNPSSYGIAPDGDRKIYNINKPKSNPTIAYSDTDVKNYREKNGLFPRDINVVKDDDTRQQLLRMMSENEDRIYSRKQYIPNANRFIQRVDILIKNIQDINKLPEEWFSQISYIVSKFGNIVHLYNNDKAFDRFDDSQDLLKKFKLNKFNISKYEKTQFKPLALPTNSTQGDIAECMAFFAYALPYNECLKVVNEYAVKIVDSLAITQKFNKKPLVKFLVDSCFGLMRTYDNMTTKTEISPKSNMVAQKLKSIRAKGYFDIFSLLIEMKIYCTGYLQKLTNKELEISSFNTNKVLKNSANTKMINEAVNDFKCIYSKLWGELLD